MAVVYLHGYLGTKYGRRFDLAVNSVVEAVRLLSANFKGFEADVFNHNPGFLIKVDGAATYEVATLREKHLNPEIHIVPVVSGAGGDDSGWTQIAMAVVIAVATYYLGPAGAGWMSTATQGSMYGMAASMAISGVISLLFTAKQNNTDAITGETNLATYAFNGPVNTTAQGNPVPVLYGQLRVGSQVVSAGISTE